MSVTSNRNHTIQQLTQQLRQWEQAGRPPHRESDLQSTGIAPLDDLLPGGGLSPGMLIESLSRNPGCGAETLACRVAAEVLQDNGVCIVIDRERSFFPAGAWPLGERLDRLVFVHPTSDRDLLWALEQSLRCRGVAVVLCRIDRLDAHSYRRLKLAAETGGGIGLLLRSDNERRQPSWADVRLLIQALPWNSRLEQAPLSGTAPFSTGRLLRMELIHCRGRAGGGAVELEIDDETGDVRLVPELAAAEDPVCAAGA